MRRRVLVPLDGSPASQDVLTTLEVMAEHSDLEVVLVGMFQPVEDVFGGSPVHRSLALCLTRCISNNVGKYLAVAEARLRAQGVATRSLVLFGTPSEDLWDLAAQENAEVLVPSRGPRGPRCSHPFHTWCLRAGADCPLATA